MRNRRGFSLIEITIMIAVGAFLFISLGRAVTSLVDNAIENRDYMIALNIAKWQMALMNNAAYPANTAETAQTADAAFPNFIPTLEVPADLATSGAFSIREVRIRVRRGSLSGPVLVLLYTYRTNLVTFGNGS